MIFSSGDTGGNGADTGDIQNSLRFRSAANAWASKSYTAGSSTADTSLYIKTYSMWVKIGALGIAQVLIANRLDGVNFWSMIVTANNTIKLEGYSLSNLQVSLETTSVLRDPSAWSHIVLSIDNTQATAANRVKLYLNGTQLAFSGTGYPAQNTSTLAFFCPLGGTWVAGVGAYNIPSNFFDGYMSRIVAVDGQALPPSSFGYLNPDSNSWVSKTQSQCKAVVDAGGANSFMLDFDNGTSLTTLGYDKSSKGNNWTLNKFSLTAGFTYDWMLDTPSNNFATVNPLAIGSGMTVAHANLRVDKTAGSVPTKVLPYSIPISKDKFYLEFETSWDAAQRFAYFGLYPERALSGFGTTGNGAYSNVLVPGNGFFTSEFNNVRTNYGAKGASGTVVLQIAFDADTRKLWFGAENAWFGGGNPALGTSPTYSSVPTDTYFVGVAVSDVNNAATGQINNGQRPFAYTPPTGFRSLCTQNLPEPVITNPKKHFDTKLHTGNGATQNITGLLFKPDFSWIKARNSAVSHGLFDSVRGAGKALFSDLTNAENNYGTTATGELYAFTSDGFSLGSNGNFNANAITYADWNWKAGGAAVANTSGSLTSQVSANTKAGFSIVTYTGSNISSATVGHGLTIIPKLIFVKDRTTNAVDDNWHVYHESAGSNNGLFLNLSNAKSASAVYWNNTNPSSSLFTIGSYNNQPLNYVAYCFAEIEGYSKIGSYLGNGASDGPFIHCGFRPAYLFYKRIDSTSNWIQFDAARNPFNVSQVQSVIDSNLAENAATFAIDILSNGFKMRGTTYNVSGATYIFYAVAGQTLKYANGR